MIIMQSEIYNKGEKVNEAIAQGRRKENGSSL